MTLLGAALLLLLALTALVIRNDVFFPGFIQPVLWSVILLIYDWNPLGLYELTAQTVAVFCFSSAIFVICAIGSAGPFRHPLYLSGSISASSTTRVLIRVVALLAIAMLPFAVSHSLEIAAPGPFDNFLTNLRWARTVDNQPHKYFTDYIFPLILVAMFSVIVFWKNFCVIDKIAIFIPGIVYVVLTSGRSFIFLMVIPISILLALKHRSRLGWIILGALCVLLLSYFLPALLMGKVVDDPGAGVLLWPSFAAYLLPSLAAFQELLSQFTDWLNGALTFRTVFAVLSAVGFSVEVERLVMEYVEVPVPTNVYTWIAPYYMDFGLMGIVFFSALVGCLSGVIYRFSQGGRPVATIAYAISCYPLFMQFFQEQYLTLLSQWMQFSFYLLILWFTQEIVPRLEMPGHLSLTSNAGSN